MTTSDEGPVARTVQDDNREQQLARLLELERSSRRIGSDARDEFDNRYELKTVTTKNVTTARDFGPEYLERLRHSYFICASGANTEFGFNVQEIYFLSPAMMDDWIRSIAFRLAGDKALVDESLAVLKETDFAGDLERLRYLGYRGLTINNPKIPWSYITSHGIRLAGNPALHLRELVRDHPLNTSG